MGIAFINIVLLYQCHVCKVFINVIQKIGHLHRLLKSLLKSEINLIVLHNGFCFLYLIILEKNIYKGDITLFTLLQTNEKLFTFLLNAYFIFFI